MTTHIEMWGNGGFSVRNRDILHAFLSNPDNTFVVSFGRTGTHWVLMLIQAYFQRPGLVGVFLPEVCPEWWDYDKYLYYHTHDIGRLIKGRNDVIYLYRNPVDTIYSGLVFEEMPLIEDNICRRAYSYGAHSAKWFNMPCVKKTLVSYDALLQDPVTEWRKVIEHFGADLEEKRFDSCLHYLSKEKVKSLIQPSVKERVVPLSEEYEAGREAFREQWERQVWDAFLKGRPFLREYF